MAELESIPMVEMSKAIREILNKDGRLLSEVPVEELREYDMILSAYLADVRDQLEKQ